MMKVGDLVNITYNNVNYIGIIHSIYNGGNTINVSFNGWCTAFYYKNVKHHLSYVIRCKNKIVIKF